MRKGGAEGLAEGILGFVWSEFRLLFNQDNCLFTRFWLSDSFWTKFQTRLFHIYSRSTAMTCPICDPRNRSVLHSLVARAYFGATHIP